MNRLILIFLGLASLLVLVFFYFQTRAVSADQYQDTMLLITKTRGLDAARAAAALESRGGLVQNFDKLAERQQGIKDLAKQLAASELADADKTSPAVTRALQDYLTALQNKGENIESFKTQFTQLRVGLSNLDSAGVNLVDAAESAGLRELGNQSREMLQEMYAYLLDPTAARHEKLEAWLNMDRLELPEQVAAAMSAFTSRGKLILRQKLPTDKLLKAVVDDHDGADLADALAAQYGLVYQARMDKLDNYRTGLLAYTVFLILAVCWQTLRLHRSYAQLASTNDELSKANEQLEEARQTLEQRVEERTAELRTAYQKLQRSQAELVHSGKMAAVGQLVAGVAHEINTPLGYVHANMEIFEDFTRQMNGLVDEVAILNQLIDQPDGDDEAVSRQFANLHKRWRQIDEDGMLEDAHNLIDDAKYGLQQISDIVLNLKGFSRVDLARESEVDLHDGLEQTLKIAHNLLKAKVKVIKEYGDMPAIVCAPGQINQVFLNLLTNAVHAIEATGRDSGTVKIKTRSDDQHVHISIQDNGIGMDEATVARVFEPFFTTKDVGSGTGLGLSISFNIVQEHGGLLRVKSIPGRGTNFQVSLPLRKAAVSNNAEVA